MRHIGMIQMHQNDTNDKAIRTEAEVEVDVRSSIMQWLESLIAG